MKKIVALLFAWALVYGPFLPAVTGQWLVVLSDASTGGGSSASSTDTFNRADANPISNPMSDGSSTWTTSAMGAAGAIQILSNQAQAAATGVDSMARVTSPSYTGQHRSQMTVPSAGITGSHFCGVIVRAQSNSNGNCYAARFYGSATTIHVEKVVDSGSLTFTELGADFTVSAVSAGDTMSLEASGTSTVTLELRINGVSQGTRTDSSSPYTGGQPGLVMYDADGARPGADAFFATDF